MSATSISWFLIFYFLSLKFSCIIFYFLLKNVHIYRYPVCCHYPRYLNCLKCGHSTFEPQVKVEALVGYRKDFSPMKKSLRYFVQYFLFYSDYNGLSVLLQQIYYFKLSVLILSFCRHNFTKYRLHTIYEGNYIYYS